MTWTNAQVVYCFKIPVDREYIDCCCCCLDIAEICPHYALLFDNNCFWSEDSLRSPSDAADRCGDRDGSLAAFPSEESVTFINAAW